MGKAPEVGGDLKKSWEKGGVDPSHRRSPAKGGVKKAATLLKIAPPEGEEKANESPRVRLRRESSRTCQGGKFRRETILSIPGGGNGGKGNAFRAWLVWRWKGG